MGARQKKCGRLSCCVQTFSEKKLIRWIGSSPMETEQSLLTQFSLNIKNKRHTPEAAPPQSALIAYTPLPIKCHEVGRLVPSGDGLIWKADEFICTWPSTPVIAERSSWRSHGVKWARGSSPGGVAHMSSLRCLGDVTNKVTNVQNTETTINNSQANIRFWLPVTSDQCQQKLIDKNNARLQRNVTRGLWIFSKYIHLYSAKTSNLSIEATL